MKALTICQPWAWAIARGYKLVENRSWETHHRGPLAIHAGLSRQWIDGGRTHLWEAAQKYDRPSWRMPDEDALDYGAIVAVADVVRCMTVRELADEMVSTRRFLASGGLFDAHELDMTLPEIAAFAGGPWCWILANIRALPAPVKCRGSQGLWNVEDTSVLGAVAR